jgi:hypothetical protein
MIYLNTVSQYSPGNAEEDREILQSVLPIFEPRFHSTTQQFTLCGSDSVVVNIPVSPKTGYTYRLWWFSSVTVKKGYGGTVRRACSFPFRTSVIIIRYSNYPVTSHSILHKLCSR